MSSRDSGIERRGFGIPALSRRARAAPRVKDAIIGAYHQARSPSAAGIPRRPALSVRPLRRALLDRPDPPRRRAHFLALVPVRANASKIFASRIFSLVSRRAKSVAARVTAST